MTEYPEEIFDAVLKVNVRSSFLACKYAIPLMNDGGSIIFTSSVIGVTADPGICAYATSKHALINHPTPDTARYSDRSLFCIYCKF